MGRVVSIVNQKGGVGKTTSAINLSAALTKHNKKVLLIDMDPQCNATTGIGHNNLDSLSIYDVILGENIKDAILNRIENFDYIPSDEELVGLETQLSKKENRLFILDENIKEIKDNYDYILIDCPPSLNILTLNSLLSSDSVIIPLQTEFYAMEGLVKLSKTLSILKNSLNKNIEVDGILFTMFDNRTILSKQVVKNVVKEAPFKVFNTIIPRNVSLGEAPSHGESIIEYSGKSAGALAYMALAKEFIARKNG